MRRILVTLVAFAAATAAPVAAHAADAPYPDSVPVTVVAVVDPPTITCGGLVTINAHATAGGTDPEGTLTVNAFGIDHTTTSSSISFSVQAPSVTKTTTYTVHTTFTAAGGSVFKSDSTTSTVTVLPPAAGATCSGSGGGDNGGGGGAGDGTSSGSGGTGTSDSGSGLLPNTGGPAWWILVAGVGLVLVGSGAVVADRRRAARGF